MFRDIKQKPLDLMLIILINFVYISLKMLAYWNTNCGKQNDENDVMVIYIRKTNSFAL